jgi:transposase
VLAICRRRKRQLEFLELLELIQRQTPDSVRRIVLVCDNLRVHPGELVRQWLAKHPRFEMFFLPVHCSWMNQIEQFFSIVQRKRLVASRFESLEHLERQLLLFVEQWNQTARPFAWTKRSFDKVLAQVELSLPAAQFSLAA